MRLLIVVAVLSGLLIRFVTACKPAAPPPSFCDTACLKDSIKFTKDNHPLKPYVYISAKDCDADTVTWSFIDMGINRKMGFSDLAGTTVKLNKDYISCFIKDTSYAWLRFNNCSNGRGFLIKIPFDKKTNISRKASALNNFDPKFSIAEGLIAYSDRGNIFVEEMATGKSAMMTFGAKVDIDYDAIHETVDSVNVTPTKVWAKVLLNNSWKTIESPITLK